MYSLDVEDAAMASLELDVAGPMPPAKGPKLLLDAEDVRELLARSLPNVDWWIERENGVGRLAAVSAAADVEAGADELLALGSPSSISGWF